MNFARVLYSFDLIIYFIVFFFIDFLGTNDKAGSPFYLSCWTSPQSIKQSFVQQTQWKYPYMEV